MSGSYEAREVHALPQRPYGAHAAGTETTLDFVLSPLELYDSNPFYAATKVRLPSDARLGGGNWGILNFLVHKIMMPLSPQKLIQNINLIYYNIDEVQPGKLLLLTAHIEKEGLLRADVSSSSGSLVARAYAFQGQPQVIKALEKSSLGSPISLEPKASRRLTRANSFNPMEKQTPRGRDPLNGPNFLGPDA
ncbi:hypothetical protein BDW75DRAFT_244934 [Aspergillus navahoensis]